MADPPLFSVRIVGAETVKKNIIIQCGLGLDAFVGAFYLFASTVITTAMRLTPYLTGYLRASRYIQRPIKGIVFKFQAGFGAPYAAAVHERQAKHATGEWKFLATALAFHDSSKDRMIAATTARLWKAGQGIGDVPVIHPETALESSWLAGWQHKKLTRAQQRKRDAAVERNEFRQRTDKFASIRSARARATRNFNNRARLTRAARHG